MKNERRHDLETNELSKRLDKISERVGPHASTIVTVVLVAVGFVIGAMYIQKSWASRQREAWDVFNVAIEGGTPNLDLLKQSAEEHAGSPMAEWSNITWADGQVWRATRLYFNNRATANDHLNKAEAAYQGLISSTRESAIRSRAHLGLARIYEMRNELSPAREHYLAVEGAFKQLATDRAEALEKDRVVEALDWLATAEAPRRASPTGPGLPGVKPEFQVDDLQFPEDDEISGPDFGELLERFGRSDEMDEDRYSAEVTDEDATSAETPIEGEGEAEADTADDATPGDTTDSEAVEEEAVDDDSASP